jgi:hypothetical protein
MISSVLLHMVHACAAQNWAARNLTVQLGASVTPSTTSSTTPAAEATLGSPNACMLDTRSQIYLNAKVWCIDSYLTQ